MLDIPIDKTKYHDGLSRETARLNCAIERKDGAWISDNEIQAQAIVDSYDPVPETKRIKIQELKDEFVNRVAGVFPAITSYDDIEFFVEFWLSISPEARAPTVKWQNLINTYTAAKAVATAINAMTDQDLIWNHDIEDW